MSDILSAPHSPGFLKLLAHELRWATLTALARSDHRVQELVATLNQPQNLVSYHLKRLRDMRLVSERRSSADARDVYYSIDLDQIRSLYFSAGEGLHPSLGSSEAQDQDLSDASGLPPVRVLFLCTHNSARSQMAEGIMRNLGGDMVEVYSAGSQPTTVQPDAVRALAAMHIDISAARSKHMDEFRGQQFDYVITVCDQVREVCPLFPGDPEQIHWSFPDPAAVETSGEARDKAFQETAVGLTTRIRLLLEVIQHERRQHAAKGREPQPETATKTTSGE